jgi:hypothetical protein
MITDQELHDIAGYIAGSCQMGPWLKGMLERPVTQEEEDQVYNYLADEGIHECEGCGWWTHPHEGDGEYCDECLENLRTDDEEE